MVKYIFKDPLLESPENIRSYENIQGAYTYIMRNWNCGRTRAKSIYQAVAEDQDISEWEETIWAINNIPKYKKHHLKKILTHDANKIQNINLVKQPVITDSNAETEHMLTKINELKQQVSQLTNLIEKQNSTQELVKSISAGFTETLLKLSRLDKGNLDI